MRKRILIVDDEPSLLFATHSYFTAQGYDVDCSDDITEAKALLACVQFAAVIADLSLNGAYGREGLELLAFARVRSPKTPFVLLTAHSTPEVEHLAQEHGAAAVLSKPMPLADLGNLVRALTAGR